MMIEEEKQRIPIAQGLPWTTDEPQVSTFTKERYRSLKMYASSWCATSNPAEFGVLHVLSSFNVVRT